MNRLKKHLKQKEIRSGDNVKWTYEHHLNSKSSTLKTKKGVFIRKIRSIKRSGGSIFPEFNYGLVHFEGNKNPSRVLIRELQKGT